MSITQLLQTILVLALVSLMPISAEAQPGPTSSPSEFGLLLQTGLLSPTQYFSQGLGSSNFTPITQGRGAFTPGSLQQATDGRYFVLIDFSPSGQQTLGLLVSSFDQALLLAYLNSVRVFFAAVPVPSGVEAGFGSMESGDDVYIIPRQTGDIDVEMALLPRGNVNPSQDYAVYFAVDPVINEVGQAHLYHSPRWKAVYTWAVADGGSITYSLWRNNPGAYTGEIDHRAGQPTPQPLFDDVSPGTAQYNALVTGHTNRSSYDLYGGFTTIPQTITPPEAVQTTPSCPLPPRMVVGQLGIVMAGVPVPNRLRTRPSLNGTQIGRIPVGEIFTVIGGPQCADEILWWQVDYAGRTGWTAEGNDGEYYIRPY